MSIDTDLKRRLAGLSPEKRAALLAKVKGRQDEAPGGGEGRGKGSGAIPIAPRDAESHPLSFAQERIWFLYRYEPESAEYNVPQAFRLRGDLDPERLRRALARLVARHELLRAVFRQEGEVPRQVIHEPGDPRIVPDLPLEDVSGADHPEAEARSRATKDAGEPFDLTAGPLVRARLYRLGPASHLLYLNVHHIAYDGWSQGILVEELAKLYEADADVTEGRGALPPLPIQYLDFGVWQRERLSGAALAEHVEYWRPRLGDTPVLELPTDRPRPPLKTHEGATHTFELPPDLTKRVRDFAATTGTTPFIVLMAAYRALLARHSGQGDFGLGTLIANRLRREVEGLIGFFANTLVLRTDASDDPSFRELVGRERESALEAYSRQELPFEKLVEELSPPRDLSRTPLFQAMFILQNAPSGKSALEIAGLEIEPVGVDSRTAKTDLTLYMTDHPERLAGFFEYNVDLFDAPTIARMADRFRRLLGGAVADPDLPISELPLLTDEERRTVVEEWNRTERELPEGATIDSLFRERAAADPSAEAVSFQGESLTYGELAERASALARDLRRRFAARGAGPEPLVGVHLERSLDMVVAVLGVMESGAAYVPLDPEYPSDRIAYMLEASGLGVVISQDELVEKLELPEPGAGRPVPEVVRIDTEWSAIAAAGESDAEAIPVRSPDALAYVIFTSGSTGQPKGVQVAHRSVVNFLRSMARRPGFEAGDTLLAVTTLSFDIAGLELYLPLVVGGRVVVASRDTAQAGEQLLAKIAEVAPSVMQATPATWRLLLEAGWKGSPPQKLLCGGEALPRELADRLLHMGGQRAELWNMYGPTETTIWSAVLRVEEGREQVPVGPPIDNTALYVLDRRLQPSPVGVPGELLIGGRGLARGYLGRPALTAERFLPDGFSGRPGARMYRTGDLVHWRPDGTVAFLGRIDHQVKVRGFRIELGEIESVLASHPKVKQAVVIVREDRPGDKRLAAYTTANEAGDGDGGEDEAKPATVGELRAHLKERLPDYMVPPIFIALDKMPLTPNGKVDRKALPAPDRNRPELGEEYVAPRNPTEAALAAIWSETLGLERIGVNDDFFELGGDSLMVIKVVSKANKQELGITTKQVFQNRTIADLAAVAGTQVLLAEQGAVSGETPFTPAQLHFLEIGHPNPGWHSLGALLEIDVLHEHAVVGALELLLEQHDNLRLRVTGSIAPDAAPGERELVTDPEPNLELHRFDLAGLSEEERQAQVRDTVFALTKGFDLANGPLFNAAIFEQGPGHPKLVFLNAHFFAADVGSWHPILDDFDTYYRHLAKGEEAPRQPKTTAAKQWAERLAERAESEELKKEVPFWTSEDRRLATPLPYDHPGGANQFKTSTQFMTKLDEEETKALLVTLPRKHGVQIDGVLVTAILSSFHRWTGGRTFLVDLLGHGREALYDDTDLTRTVGWLNTIFPVALTLDDPDDLVASMKSVNRQIRSVPNGGIGYGILRYVSRDPRMIEAMASLPQPQVFFNYFGPDNEEQLATFRKSSHWGGYVLDNETRRLRPFAVGVFVKHNQMLIKWEYSPTLHDRETVAAVVEHAEDALYALLADVGLPDRRKKEARARREPRLTAP